MIDPSSATHPERIAHELAESGWSVCADFLPPAQIAALAGELRARWTEGGFHAAGVGNGPRHRLHPDIRGDRVFWLDESARTSAQQPYFAALEVLRLAINRELFLGLFDFEGHMALYPPGSFYRRHLDQFEGVAYRKVSVILYLNDDWRPEDGGQLRIYMADSENPGHIDVVPQGGKLVCFLSERFPHEVLPAVRERCSVTGWFRIRA